MSARPNAVTGTDGHARAGIVDVVDAQPGWHKYETGMRRGSTRPPAASIRARAAAAARRVRAADGNDADAVGSRWAVRAEPATTHGKETA